MRWDQWLMVPGSTHKKKKKNIRKSGKKKKIRKNFRRSKRIKVSAIPSIYRLTKFWACGLLPFLSRALPPPINKNLGRPSALVAHDIINSPHKILLIAFTERLSEVNNIRLFVTSFY